MLSANTVLFATIVAVTKPLEFKFIHAFLIPLFFYVPIQENGLYHWD